MADVKSIEAALAKEKATSRENLKKARALVLSRAMLASTPDRARTSARRS